MDVILMNILLVLLCQNSQDGRKDCVEKYRTCIHAEIGEQRTSIDKRIEACIDQDAGVRYHSNGDIMPPLAVNVPNIPTSPPEVKK